LRQEGYEVNEASDGTEAAQIFDEEDRFDAVVSDVVMPGMDGFDLLDHVRSVAPDVPVVLMSTFSNIDPDEVIERGATGLVIKPLDFGELLSEIERVLSPEQ
jgi:two-component system, OmpR family, copper resistance phosphate regulon response regulator CusR